MRPRAMLATKAAVTPRANQPSTIHSSASAEASGDPMRVPTRFIHQPKITERRKLAAW